MFERSIKSLLSSVRMPRLVSRVIVLTVVGVALSACATYEPAYRSHRHYGSHVTVIDPHPRVIRHRPYAVPRNVPRARYGRAPHRRHDVTPHGRRTHAHPPHARTRSHSHRVRSRPPQAPGVHTPGRANARPAHRGGPQARSGRSASPRSVQPRTRADRGRSHAGRRGPRN